MDRTDRVFTFVFTSCFLATEFIMGLWWWSRRDETLWWLLAPAAVCAGLIIVMRHQRHKEKP
jgi:hypothetical protein